jgi:hypothetical protein
MRIVTAANLHYPRIRFHRASFQTLGESSGCAKGSEDVQSTPRDESSDIRVSRTGDWRAVGGQTADREKRPEGRRRTEDSEQVHQPQRADRRTTERKVSGQGVVLVFVADHKLQ